MSGKCIVDSNQISRHVRTVRISDRITNINGSDVSPMVMTMMMASTPSIVVASTNVMAPAMATAVAVDLDD